jgi:hypothetical protein
LGERKTNQEVKMLKILIVQAVIESLQCITSYFGCLEDGTVPDRFWAYPRVNGTEVEGHLIKVYPVMNIAGVETWAQDNEAEEVSVWSSDEFQERHMPKDVRWFVDKKLENTSAQPRRRSLLKPQP